MLSSDLSRDQFEQRYLAFEPTLKAYLFRLTAHREEAEDLCQETFLKAVNNLQKFNGRSSIKTWVFAIATNLARDRFRVQQRWSTYAQQTCRDTIEGSSAHLKTIRHIADSVAQTYAFREHMAYCFTCLSKTLLIEQQLAIILKDIYGFKVKEIMEILNLSLGKVKHALSNGRHTLTDIYNNRCSLVNKQGVCHECSEMQGYVNPAQEAHLRDPELQQLQQADQEDASKAGLFALRMHLIRTIDPLRAPGATLHAYLLRKISDQAQAAPNSEVTHPQENHQRPEISSATASKSKKAIAPAR